MLRLYSKIDSVSLGGYKSAVLLRGSRYVSTALMEHSRREVDQLHLVYAQVDEFFFGEDLLEYHVVNNSVFSTAIPFRWKYKLNEVLCAVSCIVGFLHCFQQKYKRRVDQMVC